MHQTIHFNKDYHTVNNKKTNLSFFCFINNPKQQHKLCSKINTNNILLIYINQNLINNKLKHSQNTQKIQAKLKEIFNEHTIKILTKQNKTTLKKVLDKSLHPLPSPYNYIAIITLLLLSISNKTIHLHIHTLSNHSINTLQIQEKYKTYTNKQKQKNKAFITLLSEYTTPIETLNHHKNNAEITSTIPLKRIKKFKNSIKQLLQNEKISLINLETKKKEQTITIKSQFKLTKDEN
ncbi:MAG: hypothetical protein VW378_00430 [bacterium]